jgi:hypothetical protein
LEILCQFFESSLKLQEPQIKAEIKLKIPYFKGKNEGKDFSFKKEIFCKLRIHLIKFIVSSKCLQIKECKHRVVARKTKKHACINCLSLNKKFN